MDIFEQASRMRPPLRFDTPTGMLTTEDLWDIQLKTHNSARHASLDDIARALDKHLKDTATTSFVEPTTTTDERLQLSFELVKHVIAVKLAERAAAATAAETKAKKARLLELIARKQDEQLSSLSVEQLQAQVNAL